MNAIAIEIDREARSTSKHPVINTVYFGGGTPSLLEAEELENIMAAVRKFNISPDAEITLEANPDDIDPQKLQGWKRLGVNRLSVGIQSFEETELKWMNRAHNSSQALQCLADIKAAGMLNFSVDQIYGSPLQSDEQLYKNLEILISNGVPHISCYALTVEPKTALEVNIRKHLSPNVSAEKQSRHFLLVMDVLRKAGYEHYEISNFALPGYRSRHNSSYWQGLPYFGFGPSAHSYDGVNTRRWNVSNNITYLKGIVDNVNGYTTEILSPDEKWNEFVMISIRTMEGLPIERSEKEFGVDRTAKLMRGSAPWIETGKMIMKDNHLVLTDEGKLYADGIASSLFS